MISPWSFDVKEAYRPFTKTLPSFSSTALSFDYLEYVSPQTSLSCPVVVRSDVLDYVARQQVLTHLPTVDVTRSTRAHQSINDDATIKTRYAR